VDLSRHPHNVCVQSYALVCGSTLLLQHTSGEGTDTVMLPHARRITALMPQSSEHALLLGQEDGAFAVWDVRAPEPAFLLPRMHGSRIRGLAPLASGG